MYTNMHLQENTVLQGGKYRIVRYISRGGFGCTYEAENVMLRTKIAIKELFVSDFCQRDKMTGHISVLSARQASLSFTISWSLLKLMSIESVMPSNHLIFCFPFSCLQSFPASGSFPMSHFFTAGGQSIGVSASASVLPMNSQD